MGRRWGKTILGGVLTLNVLRQHGKAAWIVPTYKNGRSLWRFASNICYPLERAKLMDISKSERVITTTHGGFFGIYSADNIDAIRSEWFNLVVLDEAARISQEAHDDAILPTLADADGDELNISTPKGMNHFYDNYTSALDRMNEDMAAFQAPTSSNPSPQIQKAFQNITQRVLDGLYPDRTYRQEWCADFIQDGAYFQNVQKCCVLTEPDHPDDHPDHTFGMGLDWGKVDDFTSGTIGCRECDRVVDWFRFNEVEYTKQRGRVKYFVDKWPDVRVLPERNSIGGPNIEVLREMGIEIVMGPDMEFGFQTTATTKPAIIEKLYLALQREKKYPKEYAPEFMAYEIETNDYGKSSYNAPSGQHDDRVISAALENYLAESALQVF